MIHFNRLRRYLSLYLTVRNTQSNWWRLHWKDQPKFTCRLKPHWFHRYYFDTTNTPLFTMDFLKKMSVSINSKMRKEKKYFKLLYESEAILVCCVCVCVTSSSTDFVFSLSLLFIFFRLLRRAGSWLYSRVCVYLNWFASDKWKCQICLCIVINTNEAIFDIRRFTWRNWCMNWGCAFCSCYEHYILNFCIPLDS